MLLAAGGKAHLTGRMAKKGSAHPGGDLLVCITGMKEAATRWLGQPADLPLQVRHALQRAKE